MFWLHFCETLMSSIFTYSRWFEFMYFYPVAGEDQATLSVFYYWCIPVEALQDSFLMPSIHFRALTSVKVKIQCKKKITNIVFQKHLYGKNLIQSVIVLVFSFKTNIFTVIRIIFSPVSLLNLFLQLLLLHPPHRIDKMHL